MLANETLVQAHGTSTPKSSHRIRRIVSSCDKLRLRLLVSQRGQESTRSLTRELRVATNWLSVSAHLLHRSRRELKPTDSLAPDVVQDGLDFVLTSREQRIKAALINAKGFGGNNSTAAIMSAEATAALFNRAMERLRYEDQMKSNPDKHVIAKILIAEQSRFSITMVRILWRIQISRCSPASINVPGFGKSLSLDPD